MKVSNAHYGLLHYIKLYIICTIIKHYETVFFFSDKKHLYDAFTNNNNSSIIVICDVAVLYKLLFF